MTNQTIEEIEFLKRYGINPQKLKTRWEWVDKEKALVFYREVICPHFDSTPKIEQINNLGYRGFLNAIKKTGKTHNDYLNELGLKTNFEIKYVGMSFEDLLELFLNDIYPDLREKLSLEDNIPPTKEELDKNGYRGFTYNIKKLNYNYENLLIAAGFKPLREFKYKGKSIQDLVAIFNNQIYPDLIRKKIIKAGVRPTKEILNNNGYSGFIAAIRNLGKNWTYILKESGFNPKYARLYDNKTYKQLINLFKKEIYPKIKNSYSLKDNEVPLYEHIEKNLRGFLQALTRVKKKYSDLLSDAGFQQKYGKYSGIENFEELVEIFKVEVYPDILEKFKALNLTLQEKEVPTAKMLRDLGYNSFLNKVYDICSYNDLIKASGFLPNYEYKYKDMTYKDLVDLFIDEIYPETKISFALKENEAPNLDELTKIVKGGFIEALRRNHKTYTEFISDTGLEPRQKVERIVGNNLHSILELLFIKFCMQHKCCSYYEISPNLNSPKKVDNSIFRNSTFREFIESRQNIIKIPEIIKVVNIDYTIGSRRRTINSKLNKGYQGKEKFLIIVHLGASKKKIKIPNSIPYRNHVAVLKVKEFARFMGYSGKELAEFSRIVKLAQDACFLPQAYEELKNLAKKAKKELKNLKNQQKEF